ncbi:cel3e secreted beta-glucosidase, partial [Colletotrichum incanum]
SGQGKGLWIGPFGKAKLFVRQSTLEEKINITRGYPSDNVCAINTGSMPRLGWPKMCLHDAGNALSATDLMNPNPSAIHIGASWDDINVLLGPNAGRLGRPLLSGRNWKGFSVNPYLSGQLNAEKIIELQDACAIANLRLSCPRLGNL